MRVTATRMRNHARSDEGRKQQLRGRVARVRAAGPGPDPALRSVRVQQRKRHELTAASIASAAVLTVPNFFANKYIVWRHTSRDGLRTQVTVFWVAAMLGVTLATLLTYLVDVAIAGHGWFEKVAVFCAQLTGFGIVWLARYIILDKGSSRSPTTARSPRRRTSR
ncbi:MAG: GtrA family protein [Microthrixaceae bacterium]